MFLYVVRTGEVDLVHEGRVLDVLGPGEVFGHPSLLSGRKPSLTEQGETNGHVVIALLAELQP